MNLILGIVGGMCLLGLIMLCFAYKECNRVDPYASTEEDEEEKETAD